MTPSVDSRRPPRSPTMQSRPLKSTSPRQPEASPARLERRPEGNQARPQGVPQTVGPQHRELRRCSGQTTFNVLPPRNVASARASPVVEFREIIPPSRSPESRMAHSPAPSPVAVASPSVPGVVDQHGVYLQAPVGPVPDRPKTSHDTNQFMEDLDIAIQSAVAMLPPSPPNTLADFLQGVVSGEIEPAMCHREPRIDTARYWEKRRVQNSLRRLLESLQEKFGIDGNDRSVSLGGTAYDALQLWMQRTLQGDRYRGQNAASGPLAMTEDYFERGLAALGVWPPEMSMPDRCEVFVALLAPSVAAVRALTMSQPLPKDLSRRMFCEGMARVPFNVPDFPVPTHLLGASVAGDTPSTSKVNSAARAIASVFCQEHSGIDRVQDFFLCGLISLEEIQVALLKLLPLSVIEEAVLKIIRVGAMHFTAHEWEVLVHAPRMNPEGGCSRTPDHERGQSVEEGISEPSSPEAHGLGAIQQQLSEEAQALARHFSADGPCTPAPRHTTLSPTAEGESFESMAAEEVNPRWATDAGAEAYDSFHQEASPKRKELPPSQAPSAVPMTEPLPSRQLRSEEPVTFAHSGAGRYTEDQPTANSVQHPWHQQCNPSLIDWGTTMREREAMLQLNNGLRGGDPEHAADQGAGSPTPEVVYREVFSSTAQQARSPQPDPVLWISAEMHNECRGPFLMYAFVRCCQLYEAQRGSDLGRGRRLT